MNGAVARAPAVVLTFGAVGLLAASFAVAVGVVGRPADERERVEVRVWHRAARTDL